MDKLFRNTWFIKIISLLIAIALFSIVTSEDHDSNNNSNIISNGNDTQTINEDLSANYNDDKYIVLGLPSSVQVRLRGPSEIITNAKLQRTHKAFVDLKNKKPGRYEVPIQTSGFSSSLDVEVIPSTVTVTIQKKLTKTFPVSVDLLNRANIADGYSVGDYEVSPETVSVTGAEEIVNQIAFVKGVIDLKDVSKSVDETVPLNAYDKNGNQLTVDIKPATAKVKIPIENPSKEVPISVIPKGEPSDGYAIESMDVAQDSVKVFGEKDTLDGLSEIKQIEVPVDGLRKTETVQVDVPVPKDAERVEPDKIDVTVHVGKETTRTIEDIPIMVNDIASKDRDTTFTDPESGALEVEVTGAESVLNQLRRTDITATIDVSKLSSGKHEVPIKLEVPDFLHYKLKISKAEINIRNGKKAKDSETE
ncbi:YbbR domain-containing protein [Pullulanibacillus pueri]|uniref:YbbR-like domain-containing protein n=1 Tax=Pullulanibacillus pueri TaxID=1437324 RepID=A0A8J2ZZR3_9BACL|nr:CdaR family protein [Pullulanibacillus pueri]MBM7684198.1 YbbR domain-containing protein [Pullulanibacillus pueri]GGH88934.1 hypothetical protein GCM10007096_42390 [Pullulanibacillus pueri]